MLKMIKMITLQVLNSQSDETEQEDVDYFSQHIYQAPPVVLLPPEPHQPLIQQSVAPIQTFQSTNESNTTTHQSSPPSHQSVEVSSTSETETNILSTGFDQVDTVSNTANENNSSTGLI